MKFITIAKKFEEIEDTSSRLEMMDILAGLFKEIDNDKTLKRILYLSQGQLDAEYKNIDFGIGEKLMVQDISLATGYNNKEINSLYNKIGDLGNVAEKLLKNRKQNALMSINLTTEKVYNNFHKLAKMSGSRSQNIKIKLIAELITSAQPIEARYIVRMPLNKLRLGMSIPTIIDAIALAYLGTRENRNNIEKMYNVHPDIGWIALKIKKEKKIVETKPQTFIPIKSALAERLTSAEDIFDKLGECYVDAKYDGFRTQIHKFNNKVKIYSRKMEDITHMFPDIVNHIKKLKLKKFIIDAEALAYNEKDKKYYSFQETIKRKRKYNINKTKNELPIKLFIFDILLLDNKSYIDQPFKKRRKILEHNFKQDNIIRLSDCRLAKSASDIKKMFKEMNNEGLEGIIAKDPDKRYVAGARKFAWIKLKKSYGSLADTMDLVIIGYYRGKGQRAEFGFGGLLTATYNEERDLFETVAKIGSGFTEDEMKIFKELLTEDEIIKKPKEVDSNLKPDYWVNPKYVIKVLADEITLSPVHTCNRKRNKNNKGYALRFPRIIELRETKGRYDATSSKEVQQMYDLQ